MKRKYNRIWALTLAGMLGISSVLPVHAAETNTNVEESAVETEDTESTAEADADIEAEESVASAETEVSAADDDTVSDTGTAENTPADTAVIDAEYLYAELSEDETIQNVVVKLDTAEEPSEATLTYTDGNGTREVAATEIIDNFAAFELPASENRTFLSVESSVNQQIFTTDLEPLENGEVLDADTFAEAADTSASDEELSDTQLEMVENSVVTLDLTEEVSTSDLLASAAVTSGLSESKVQTKTAAAKKKIIVLDPGHGAAGTGTSRDWGDFKIDEATINLKISQYTKAALEANYSNIEVYMTRTTMSGLSLADRVKYGVQKKADLFVSQHINATGEKTTTAHGVLAFVPQVDSRHSYNKESALASQEMARDILAELEKIGFNNMNFQYRLSESNDKYADGSIADYYGIVRHCRLNKLPGAIIEHGFANNRSDALKLHDEAMLKKIGEADARGIAKYLGLAGGSSSTPDDTSKEGWEQKDSFWLYRYADGSYATAKWVAVKGTWYYFDNTSHMVTGWLELKDKWYYMNPSGAMVTGWLKQENNWYYMGSSGDMQTGWQKIGKTWYYMNEDGVMQTGRVKSGESWYYMNQDGAMTTGWQKIDEKWYYMNTSGAAQTGWQKIGKTWYYMDEDGIMQTGWVKSGESWYYMNQDGAMTTGWQKIKDTWYYMNASGAMTTGWQKIGKTWYYMNTSGAMASDTWIGNDYVNASGAWIPNYSTGRWIRSDSRWWFRHNNGTYTKNGWEKIKGIWYYFDKDGWMVTGWLEYKGKTYYLNEDGVMVTGKQVIEEKTYDFDADGVLKSA